MFDLLKFMNYELFLERIYHDRYVVLEGRREENVRFELMDGRQLYKMKNSCFGSYFSKHDMYLFTNCSSPLRRSSINSSSKIPSSRRKNAGICRFQAFDGNCGTTI